jgi:hypothetical protein
VSYYGKALGKILIMPPHPWASPMFFLQAKFSQKVKLEKNKIID